MAIVVEDGSGDPLADSYISVAYADAYHLLRDFTVWAAATTTAKEAAIVKATDHIERRFGHRFRGDRRTQGQALAWPRQSAYMNSRHAFDDVPRALQKACAEYAVRALNYGVLTPDTPAPVPAQSLAAGETLATSQDTAGRVARKREKVGPVEIDVRILPGSVSDMPDYPAADLFLVELLRSSLSAKLVRG